jgi:HAD superfamily hydrolase (TIGR01509 family)
VTVIKAVLFDLGDTLIHERVDDVQPLDRLPLHAKPGASDVLSRLAQSFTLGLVTDTESSDEQVVRSALDQLGLSEYFRAIVTSQDLGVTKPDPAMFREALRRVGAEPAEAVMVGNDLDRDVTPALALGMRAILVSDSAYFDPSSPTPAPIAPTLREVPAMVLAMAGGGPEVADGPAPKAESVPPAAADTIEDSRSQYAAAVTMSVYDGQLSWQVTGLYVQFAFLLAAGAVFPSFVGSTNRLVLAAAGALVSLAGLVTALMFGSMCMRVRTYQDLWVARAVEIEEGMSGPGVLSAGSLLSSARVLRVGSETLRMSWASAVRTKTMMNVLFMVFVLVFFGLLVLNLTRAAAAL